MFRVLDGRRVDLTPAEIEERKADEARAQAERREREKTAYADARRAEILAAFPIHAQLEALTESAAGRPEKLAALLAHINAVKAKHPKPNS